MQGLNLILKLLIPAGGDDLDPLFAVPGPNNALYPLWRHLSHKDNAALIPALESAVALSGKGPLRLLRILTPALFPKDRYHTWRRIARGASAEVSAAYELPLRGTGINWLLAEQSKIRQLWWQLDH